jgi:hypothetical protein
LVEPTIMSAAVAAPTQRHRPTPNYTTLRDVTLFTRLSVVFPAKHDTSRGKPIDLL